jgi:hypothetical protein
MVVLAILLGGWYLSGQDRHAREMAHARQAAGTEAPPPSAEERQLVNRYGAYWLGFSVILFAIMALALVDFLAIRRFYLRSYRQIKADRNEMLQREIVRLRSERNGH